jgi:hypothetical protein
MVGGDPNDDDVRAVRLDECSVARVVFVARLRRPAALFDGGRGQVVAPLDELHDRSDEGDLRDE